MKLPKNVCLSGNRDFRLSDELADRLNEEITDFLSGEYGFCVNAYGWELKAVDINWDTTE